MNRRNWNDDDRESADELDRDESRKGKCLTRMEGRQQNARSPLRERNN